MHAYRVSSNTAGELRTLPQPGPMIEQQTLEVPAKLEVLGVVSSFVTGAARAAGLDEHAVWEVQLAVDEAVTNIITHAYQEHDLEGPMWIEVGQRDALLVITLRDHGARFNPDDVPEPDLVSPLEERKTGGLGLFLMRKLMQDVVFKHEDDCNILQLTKPLPPQGLRFIPLAGRIDAAAAPVVQRSIQEIIDSGGRWVVVDMAEVTFVSSSGLRALLLLTRSLRKKNGDLRLCSLQPQVSEVFKLTGFDQIFPLYPNRQDAAASFPID